MNKELTCPFCGKKVKVLVCDDEGNIHSNEYANDPWSGLGFMLAHEESKDVICPIATERGGTLGRLIYDSREEAIKAWDIRTISQEERENKNHETD